MEHTLRLLLIIGLPSLSSLAIIFLLFCCCLRRRKWGNGSKDLESSFDSKEGEGWENSGDLIKFQGGENLSVGEILDAPGEVIGKSSYGTLYRALLVNSNSFALLRFLRPTCTLSVKEVVPIVEFLGSARHQNLVPLKAFYAGPRGEKLMVHPFYRAGNLADFIRDGNGELHRWPVIERIALGIARGIHYLHTAFEKPIIHGNLNSKNVLLDSRHNPYVSDFALHLLVTATAAQEMLEASASKGYKPPELIKMKDASEDSDIYSFGIILLELLTGKEPVNENPIPGEDSHLLDTASSAILDDRIGDLFRPSIFSGLRDDQRAVVQDCAFKYFQLAMACCATTRLLRPHINQVLDRLEEIRV